MLGLGVIALALVWAFGFGLALGALWGARLTRWESQGSSPLTFEERCKIEALEESLRG